MLCGFLRHWIYAQSHIFFIYDTFFFAKIKGAFKQKTARRHLAKPPCVLFPPLLMQGPAVAGKRRLRSGLRLLWLHGAPLSITIKGRGHEAVLCECHVNAAADDGTVFYGGFYHLCGTLLDGESAWKKISRNTSRRDNDAACPVSPGFHASFQNEAALLEEGFATPVVQAGFSARIPRVLNQRNPYGKRPLEEETP